MASLENKGVYPLNSNNWWLAHPAGRVATPNATTSSNKDCRYWYCACCGGRDNVGKHLPCRQLLIVPPKPKHDDKKAQGK
eukprot:12917764-Prorocentrum_lima.AAC.1